ncbi:flagellar protein FlaG [Bacillus sp. DTU_2020_1000418_1_SI_GHA_SEK_038]|uniref:flagellar protein FlaG n=1 Tax=Bacillus sp. DTU_2020_1000418_1_SI_GHA_SEK_038 TaxID=3077585 RepID=UPI0028EE744D|nr:flagellar protein FlaG [Bacillus sp. DTU_2020_1000418_1_SI_GHA_SEK_038]WNS75078.1 flagellar protein FlaG [Bacillus sp. DTU_2020_1000418_1_SI_GHA_SEK_038]
MIDRLSASSFSSQLRTTEIIDKTTNQKNINENIQITDINQPKLTKQKVEEVVQSMNDFIQPAHTSLKFEFHDKLGEYYVTITDDVTKEVIKEIPSKKMLDMYAAMTEFLGLMVDKKV